MSTCQRRRGKVKEAHGQEQAGGSVDQDRALILDVQVWRSVDPVLGEFWQAGQRFIHGNNA